MDLRFFSLFIAIPFTLFKESGHNRSMILRSSFLLIGSVGTFLFKSTSWILSLPLSLHLIDLLVEILLGSKERDGKSSFMRDLIYLLLLLMQKMKCPHAEPKIMLRYHVISQKGECSNIETQYKNNN